MSISRELPIGTASPSDAPAIAVMSRDLIEFGLGWEYRHQRIMGMLASGDTTAIVARDAARVAAFAIMTLGEERAHLVLLAVRPSYQRCGVAHRMLAWLTQTCVVAGAASLHLELRVTNASAFAFYKSEGFSETLRVPGYYRGQEAGLRMIKVLRNPLLPLPAWEPPTLDDRER